MVTVGKTSHATTVLEIAAGSFFKYEKGVTRADENPDVSISNLA